MRDQSAVILCLVVSSVAIWIIVLCLLGMKIREILKSRIKIKASVMNESGGLKNEYILGKQKEVLIGKSTPVNLVNIDFSDSKYAATIEEEHACFQKFGSFWYILSKAENGMVGLKQKGDNIVYKLRRGIPYRIVSGDIVYISYEKIKIQ